MKLLLQIVCLVLITGCCVSESSSTKLGINECTGPEECCTRNWDLQLLSINDCYDLCSYTTCTMETSKDIYYDYLASLNTRDFGGGTTTNNIRVVGLSQQQRNCLRYFDISQQWYKGKCCFTGGCTEFPDNFN